MKRVFVAIALTMGLAMAAAAPANAYLCQSEVVSSGKPSLTKLGAYASSWRAWRRTINALYGSDYEPWRRAENKSIDCAKGIKNGKSGWICTRRGRPCSLTATPGSSGTSGITAQTNRNTNTGYKLSTNTLRPGDSGNGVRYLQQLLQDIGYDVAVNGDYDSATENAVADFQRGHGLADDGRVGPNTRTALLGTGKPKKTLGTIFKNVKQKILGKIAFLGTPIIETLRRGDQNKQVVTLQKLLSKHGYPLEADGNFGSGTMAAVEKFQDLNGLSIDGVVGPATLAKLVG